MEKEDLRNGKRNSEENGPLIIAICCIVVSILIILPMCMFTQYDSQNTLKSILESDDEKVEVQKFKLVSCYVEFRDRTNGFGGITGRNKYLHYAFELNGEVVFKEKKMSDNYSGLTYELKFVNTDEDPEIVQESRRQKTTLTFYLTDEMWKDVFGSK